ncbi:SLC13 family permease [Rhodococcus rhodnii]|uniref:Transporter n=1 Tax=Rhodococcus rhodnii LMG 5362 TaxID=1273125 RepID=R7WKN8_9NOCA|nr:SLC13 family permease [Rhodococcus rhodnii]EOM74589.1 hypothetical protein Rrhod_4062 [Rhodococcus rhodnii LMG 5362]
MTITEFRTSPPPARTSPAGRTRPAWHVVVSLVVAALAGAGVVAAAAGGELSRDGAVALAVFVAAVWLWIFTPLDDTYVALGAAISLVVLGPLEVPEFTGTLGESAVWLLVGAFVVAAAVTTTGLPTRLVSAVVTRVGTPRGLIHATTALLTLSAFVIPATSGRAALALPVFLALAHVLADRPRVVLALAVAVPSVILTSAVASLTGAGAHLVSSEILRAATGHGFGYVQWLVLGLPLAVVWSHLAAEIALTVFTDRTDRTRPLNIPGDSFSSPRRWTDPERRILIVLTAVVLAWCTGEWHGIDPAIVALAGALAATAPGLGVTTLGAAVAAVPWPLLLFMAATFALGLALTTSGATAWLAESVFAPVAALGDHAQAAFLVTVVLVSLAAHLLIQSRSARSAVLIPVIVATATTLGVPPATAVFVSTAAAGFCHTLTSSAKPVAMFARSEDVPGFAPADLLRYSAALAPVSAALLLAFTLWVWPALGLPTS